jgi:outer membrane autotransporter protein
MPFGEATDGLPAEGSGSGIGIWLRPTAQFASYKANREAGASQIDLNNHGGSIGLNYATGSGGNFGIAGGYGRLDVNSGGPVEAEADTYMVGAYASQQTGRLHLSAQAVYGRSDWTASRTLPLLGRTARTSFDSDEIRGSVRIAYTLAMLPGIDFSPFARGELRRYSFDGFTETGAGAVSLAVGSRSKTVFSPEVGARMSGSLDEKIRPFAEASYIFMGDVGSDRQMSFTGGTGQNFTVNGVDPDHSIKGAIGVAVDVGRGSLFVRGDYRAGGEQQVGSVRGGLLFSF